MQAKLTGLSLSFCVKDILAGKIPEEAVLVIFCGFDRWEGQPDASYYAIYWRDYPRTTVDALLARLTIRAALCNSRNISQGHWMAGTATAERMVDQFDRLRTEDALAYIETGNLPKAMTAKRIRELRAELTAERISYGELAEIESAAARSGVQVTEEMMAGDILDELERIATADE